MTNTERLKIIILSAVHLPKRRTVRSGRAIAASQRETGKLTMLGATQDNSARVDLRDLVEALEPLKTEVRMKESRLERRCHSRRSARHTPERAGRAISARSSSPPG